MWFHYGLFPTAHRSPTVSFQIQRNLDSISGRGKDLSLLQNTQTVSGTPRPTIPAEPRTLSSRVKWPGREADNSPPSAEVMKLCGYISALPCSLATCTIITSPSPLHCTNAYNTSNFTLLSYIRFDGGTVSRYSINLSATFTFYSQKLRFIFIGSNCRIEKGCFKGLIMYSPIANLRHLCAPAVCLLPTVTYCKEQSFLRSQQVFS
jgi:hypothetical protein